MRTDAKGRQATVVVIDDEEAMRAGCSQILEQAGYRAVAAPDAHKGIELAMRLRPEIALVDLRMPEMSGLEALRELRRHSRDTMLVAMTAYAEPDTAVEAMRAGAWNYLRKPFDEETLLRTVHAAAARYRAKLRSTQTDAEPGTNSERLAVLVLHRLQTPVTALVQCVAQSSREPALTPDAGPGDSLARLSGQLEQVSRLIEDWRLLAELETAARPCRTDAVNTRLLLEHAWPIVSERTDVQGVQFECRVPEDAEPLACNEALLLRLFVNVLTNAVKRLAGRGRVRVEQTIEGGQARLAVTDTGVPVSAQEIPFMFDPFCPPVHAAAGPIAASGFEMAVARAVAHAHKGDIQAESLIGGTKLTVSLPLADRPSAHGGNSGGAA